MARVFLRKAAKDYPSSGIKKGDRYYFAKMKTGPYSSRTIRQLKPITRSQLTNSDFYAQLWDIEDAQLAAVSEAADLNDIAQALRDLGTEQQDKYDNMPDGLRQGDTGQLLEQRANQCEEWAGEIESVANDLESKLAAFDEAAEQYASAKADYDNAMSEYDPDGDEPEPEEPDVPEELQDCADAADETEVQQARQSIIDEAVEEANNANPGIE